MLVKITHGGLYSSTGEKNKTHNSQNHNCRVQTGNHTRAAGGAATKQELGVREEKGEAGIHKRNEHRWMICYRVPVVHSQLATTGSMIATLKQPSFLSDDEGQEYSSAPQVTMQLLSGERERKNQRTK